MNTERILKNILWRPKEAFKKDVLQETLSGAIAAFLALGLISSIFGTPQKIISRHPALAQFPHIVPLALFILMFLGICTQMAVVQFFIQVRDRDVDLKTLTSGALWIYCVTVPLGWILQFTFSGWSHLITLPYRVWLMTICIHCLTDFTKQESFWLYVRAVLSLLVATMIVAAVFVVLLLLSRSRYP